MTTPLSDDHAEILRNEIWGWENYYTPGQGIGNPVKVSWKAWEAMKALLSDRDRLAAENARLTTKLAEYEVDLIAEHESTVRNDGHFYQDGKNAGWWGTCALSHVCEAGDWLVEKGLWEIKPDGYGRAQFYRPLEKAQ